MFSGKELMVLALWLGPMLNKSVFELHHITSYFDHDSRSIKFIILTFLSHKNEQTKII